MKQKKFSILAMAFAVVLSGMSPALEVRAERAIDVARRRGQNLEDRYQPAGSIITEIETGQILWQEDAAVSWKPASMTKLMVVLLAYDAIEQGKFTMETQVPVSKKYLEISVNYKLSNNVMKEGASYTVSELMDLIIVPSSAAATYMLADLIEPDPDKFAELMNQKAADLKMTQTTYYNPVGVANSLLVPYQPVNQSLSDDNVTSPTDYALLCSYFVKKYPDILNHTKHPQITVKAGTPYEEHFKTYQISLEGAKYGLEGTDGLKTGSSDAGFNYSSTAKRGDTRLVEVVMGVSTWEDQTGEEIRHLVGNAIMEEAFEQYEYRIVLPKGTHTIGEEKITIEKDFWDCVPKNQEIPLKLHDGKVMVDLERSYLPGYKAPAVAYKTASKAGLAKKGQKKPGSLVILGFGTVIVLGGIAAGAYYLNYKRKRKLMRKLRRRRRRP